MTKTATYEGPEGFAIPGLGELTPGEEYEVDDSLAQHAWFGGKEEPEQIPLPRTHAELDELALEQGVVFPEGAIIETKQKILRGEETTE